MFKKLLGCILLVLPFGLGAEVYDCFLFFNEFDVLEIRFNELYEHVDKFVIVESVETFTGHPKPMFFFENMARFENFLDKVIYVPIYEQIQTNSPWDRERFQRDQILRGLQGCKDDDLIMISDVDEIPRSTAFPLMFEILSKHKDSAVIYQQTLYRYFLNQFDYTVFPWPGTYAMHFHSIKNRSPDKIRVEERATFVPIPYGGWHFCSLGGVANWIQKIESFSHSEVNLPERKNMEYIRFYLSRDCIFVPIDESYPKYVQENIPYFMEKGFIDP